MLDVHIHLVPPNLPGAGPLSPLLDGPADRLASALRQEMQACGVRGVLAMGRLGGPPDDPLGIEGTLRMARLVHGVGAVGIADPSHTTPEELRRADAALATGQVLALKAYLGYVHAGPDHPGYAPYYELAARHGVPF